MSVLGRLRSWFKGLDLLGTSKDGEKGLPVAPAPSASVDPRRNTEQRVPSNAVAAAPAAIASAQGHGASNAQAPQARASATFPAASEQQQPQGVTQPASHNKQAAASGPVRPWPPAVNTHNRIHARQKAGGSRACTLSAPRSLFCLLACATVGCTCTGQAHARAAA